MKKAVLILALFLSACATEQPEAPTPFSVGAEVDAPLGCIALRKAVEEYNKTHLIKKVADC